MTVAETLNYTLYGGDDFADIIEQVDDEENPLDRTGYTYEAQIRVQHESTDILDEFTIDTTDLAIGIIILSLTGEQTAALPTRSVFDLEETSPGGLVTTLFTGTITRDPEVTR